MGKHFEKFTMDIIKAHRMEHDKGDAYSDYLTNILSHKKASIKSKGKYSNKSGKDTLTPVLLPLMASPNSLGVVATSIVFIKKSSRRISRGSSGRRAA